MKTSITAGLTALLALSAADTAGADTYRQEPEAGYRFESNTLVMPNGQTISLGDGVTKYEVRGTYGLTGPDRAMTRTIFTTSQGQRYQVGYRIEGNTLHLPAGGKHELPKVSPEQAVSTLREAYGLVGDPTGPLVRTKW